MVDLMRRLKKSILVLSKIKHMKIIILRNVSNRFRTQRTPVRFRASLDLKIPQYNNFDVFLMEILYQNIIKFPKANTFNTF